MSAESASRLVCAQWEQRYSTAFRAALNPSWLESRDSLNYSSWQSFPKLKGCTECHKQNAFLLGEVGLWFVLFHPHWFLIHCNLKITSFSEPTVDLHSPGSSSRLFHLRSSSSLWVFPLPKDLHTWGISFILGLYWLFFLLYVLPQFSFFFLFSPGFEWRTQ